MKNERDISCREYARRHHEGMNQFKRVPSLAEIAVNTYQETASNTPASREKTEGQPPERRITQKEIFEIDHAARRVLSGDGIIREGTGVICRSDGTEVQVTAKEIRVERKGVTRRNVTLREEGKKMGYTVEYIFTEAGNLDMNLHLDIGRVKFSDDGEITARKTEAKIRCGSTTFTPNGSKERGNQTIEEVKRLARSMV